MNDLQIFKNEKFGEIRVIIRYNEPWFVASDACRILDLSNPTMAIERLDEDERSKFNLGRQGETNIVNEPGLYALVLGSRKPEAKAFKRWLTHEVIPSIRKTGTYTISDKPDPKYEIQLARAKAMETNSRVRAAQTWLKIAAVVNIPEYKQIASTYAANTLAEKEIMQLPKTPAKTYTATEIGNILGVSANKIGKLANSNGVKIKEYGIEVWDKSPHSAKQIPSWRYYEKAIPVFRHLLSHEVKPLEVVKGGVSQ